MKKFQTLDGYHVYRIRKEKRFFFLADRLNYKKEIDKLLHTLEDIRFDSLIFIFGIDTGEYINNLQEVICEKNKVIIFEPNKTVFKKFTSNISENIKIVFFDKKAVKNIFLDTIHFKNANNVYFHAFGEYESIYKKEYDQLIEQLDASLINASSQLSLAKRFNKVFMQNMIANLKILNQCIPIQSYQQKNQSVPAMVVSAGPSLERNLKDMLLYKEKVEQCFVITGSRTVNALLKNGITPDMIVSVDPVDANYDMMKDHLDLEIPLAFYEYSNRFLMKEYKGSKVYIPTLFTQTIESFSQLKGIYSGGSVAHACIDICNMMGCSPILLVGQDLAYTNQKHHAESAVFDYDKTLNYKPQIRVKDIFGEPIFTTMTLEHFKKKLEEYIELYKGKKHIEFINCSYGAAIKGAPHKELKKILSQDIFDNKKMNCLSGQMISLESKEIIVEIKEFIESCMKKAGQGIELSQEIIAENQTKSLVEVEEEDIDLQKVLYMIQLINEFENATNSRYLGGYFTEFLYKMKESTFFMLAKDYVLLTSDLQHQAKAFYIYFSEMKEMLSTVKELIAETVIEFYE